MLKIIATSSKADDLLIKVEQLLKNEMNIYVDKSIYRDSFGGTLWSIDDLCDTKAKDWPEDKKLRFMEFAAQQIKNDAIERGWESINILLTIFDIDNGDGNLC